LGACPRLSVLATSREPLDLASEHCYRVPPLAYPAPGSSPTPGDARRSPAVQLFLARARMARADFPMTDANVLGALAACAQLDGAPLPIVLAAGEVTTMGPGAIAQRLREGRRPVGSAAADVPEHHRSVDHAIATSWRALDGGEQRVLAALAVFAGGFTAGAAAAVAGEADDATEAVLARLVRKSLVEARPDAPSGPRFELLESVRRHALARLDTSGGLPLTRRRHLDHFLAVAQDGDRRFAGSGQGQALVVLDAERDNLAAAFDWALAHEPEEAVALAAALWRYFLRGDIPTGRRWLAGALAAAIEETPARAMALAGAGALAWVSGDAAVAAEALAAAAKLAERLDLPDVAAVAALNDAALAEQQGRLDDADVRFEQARQLYDRLGDRRGRACALTGQGVVCRRRGDVAAATGLWAEALGLFRAVGDLYSESMVLGNLARAAENAGRYEEAQRWNGMRQRIQVSLGDGRGLAATTAALGRLAHLRGDSRLALALQRDALVAFHRLGDRPWAASTLVAVGALAVEAGAAVEGLMLGAAAEALWEGMGAAPRGEDEAQRDRLLEAARAALGEAAFAGVFRAGRALTLEEAVKIADEVASGGAEKPPPPATG
ncbi:MAG TPA: hypothetical protein VM390_00560, partial [Acidimicrobiales bacterium]|nr:hypothetical protein [Acidimicrobiales bacterium]